MRPENVGTIYLVQYPRGGGDTDAWGHPNLTYMNGWQSGSASGFLTRSMDSYTGQLVYCIEPGVHQNSGDQLSGRGEDFWENYPDDLNRPLIPIRSKPILAVFSSMAIPGIIRRPGM